MFNTPKASSGLISIPEGQTQGKTITMPEEQADKEVKKACDSEEGGSAKKCSEIK